MYLLMKLRPEKKERYTYNIWMLQCLTYRIGKLRGFKKLKSQLGRTFCRFWAMKMLIWNQSQKKKKNIFMAL